MTASLLILGIIYVLGVYAFGLLAWSAKCSWRDALLCFVWPWLLIRMDDPSRWDA